MEDKVTRENEKVHDYGVTQLIFPKDYREVENFTDHPGRGGDERVRVCGSVTSCTHKKSLLIEGWDRNNK